MAMSNLEIRKDENDNPKKYQLIITHHKSADGNNERIILCFDNKTYTSNGVVEDRWDIALQGYIKENEPKNSLNFHFYDNSISLNSDDLSKMMEVISEKININSLIFSKFELNPDKIIFFGNILSKNLSIRSIDLGRSSWGIKGLQLLEEGLANNSHITSLNLSYYLLREEEIKILASILNRHNTLTELDLSHANLGRSAISAMSHELKKLKHLSIRGCIRPLQLKDLSEVLKMYSSIEYLDISNNYLAEDQDYTGLEAFANALKCNTSLQTLKMFNNIHSGIQNKSYCIFWALKTHPAISNLEIANITLDHLAVRFLMDVLNISKTLKTLNLVNCHLDNDGFKKISKTLQNNTTLETLKLVSVFDRENSYKDRTIFNTDGIAAFAKALKHNKKLTFCDLSGNELTTNAINLILEALVSNTNLYELKILDYYIYKVKSELKYNPFVNPEVLCNLLKENKTLASLNLGEPIQDFGRNNFHGPYWFMPKNSPTPNQEDENSTQILSYSNVSNHTVTVESVSKISYDVFDTIPKALKCNPSLTFLKIGLGDKDLEEYNCGLLNKFIDSHCEKNVYRARNWSKIYCALAFYCANQKSPFRDSILPLLSIIGEFAAIKKSKEDISTSNFIGTQYAMNVINLKKVTAVKTLNCNAINDTNSSAKASNKINF